MPETKPKLSVEEKQRRDREAEEEFRKLTERTAASLPKYDFPDPGEEVSRLTHFQCDWRRFEGFEANLSYYYPGFGVRNPSAPSSERLM
ncbi:MAG: hypothetical protein AAF399_09605 [Bacteroidota bacterium]